MTKEEEYLYDKYLETVEGLELLGKIDYGLLTDNLSTYQPEEFLEKYKTLGNFWRHHREDN